MCRWTAKLCVSCPASSHSPELTQDSLLMVPGASEHPLTAPPNPTKPAAGQFVIEERRQALEPGRLCTQQLQRGWHRCWGEIVVKTR